MLRFKEWLQENEKLLAEGGFGDEGSDWFYGAYLYPSDAFDWQHAYPYPGDYLFLQNRWKGDRTQGRKFYNMDIDPIIHQKFVTLQSNTMPGEGQGFWQHHKDNRPNVSVVDSKLELIGYGKTADNINKLVASNDLLDMTDELNKKFGQFTPKYPLEADDSEWVHKKEKT